LEAKLLLSTILKDSDYRLTQFKEENIQKLESRIVERKGKYYVDCLNRKKEILLKPEEIIRQLYIMTLMDDLGYHASRMALEYPVTFGRETKRADIVILDKDRPDTAYIIVELKKPKLKDGKEQLKSYCNATGAPIGVWTNGESISYYHRKDPNFFEDISGIPKATEKLSDILSERWTINDLVKKDKLVNERKSLKDLILEMEDEVLANAGVDVFEELFKLIFTKLYDEMESGRNTKRYLEFRNYGDTETELKTKIQNLFEKAGKKWEGVFSPDSKIELTTSHLSVCVSSLQDVKLFNSNLEVVDEAFEYLINKSSKGEKGQYFTPRYVIDMCVKMLNPKENETMIDTASGSCGFPVHTIFYVWERILRDEGFDKSHLFTLEQKPPRCVDYVNNNVFAIDFDERAVRVGRTLNLIAGDGQTNVLHLNTLDYERWNQKTDDSDWIDTYNDGWKKLKKMRVDKSENREFQFDILMANPPFAGDIKESRILAKYELGKNSNGKYQTKVGRDILFIERNLDFLKPGGRMAIVLPQGRFNNSSDKQIREFIAERCRILAVVGLHGNVFKPHTGTKTSVLFVQKWDNVLCPKKDDYPIFFATMQEPSKDNSGEKIYMRGRDKVPPNSANTEECEVAEVQARYETTPKEADEYYLDEHGHLIVKHDLFNHDGLTQDGIAEAFMEFAKKERLSFF
jgi:type I restriction enzyme M protein